jgi:maleylacetoacetate isomerase
MELSKDSLITLYGYYRSSCSARLRLALNFKSLPYKTIPLNIAKQQQRNDEYAKINASQTVPTLVVGAFVIPQSLPALEFLEEFYFHTTSLLPKDSNGRAMVRSMATIIVADVQVVTNLKVLRRVEEFGCEMFAWAREFTAPGFQAYEAIASRTAGKYSYGDSVTLADVCLVPAIWNAERFGLNLELYPTILRVYKHLSILPEVRKAHWKAQEDCPTHLRD